MRNYAPIPESRPRYVVERDVKRLSWTVTSIVEAGGKTFKNFVGEGRTKAEAEAIAEKARQKGARP